MTTLLTGTLTFLFTDIEGSTALWENQTDAMRASLARHDEILRERIQAGGGTVFKTVGDAFCAVFASAPDAVCTAVAIQEALAAEHWVGPGLQVRIGLHSGDAELREGDYFGPTLNRVARLQSVGHGGQVLLSQATFVLVRDQLPSGTGARSLGLHRLKDLQRPEEIVQVTRPSLRNDFPPLRTLESYPNNLPVQLTSFVGRAEVLTEIQTLLGSTRLLTLAGSGGTGKTRLALQAAAELLEDFADGVRVVELAPLADPDRVAETAAKALGLQEDPARAAMESLKEFVGDRRMLLVLDNCEHLLDACSALSDALLHAAPGLRIIATSREPLGIAGETILRVPSLGTPGDSDGPHTAESLAQCEAAQLFIDRARATDPHFVLTDANAPALAQICSRLDGMPLAIELAAARIKVLSVEQIAVRLDDRFRLLTGGSRTALPRQQTLRATIDWSDQLLTEEERTVLRRLSVFAGGWGLEAAEAVCATGQIESGAILDLLTRLVDRSLVVVDQGEQARYRLLETIRQYAREKLLDGGEVESAREAHLDWAVGFAERTASMLNLPDQFSLPAYRRLEKEADNLRSAIDWARAEPDPPARFIRMVGALGWYWANAGPLVEGAALAEEAAHRSSDDDRGRVGVLNGVGLLAWRRGEGRRAMEAFELGLQLSQKTRNAASTMRAHYGLGLTLLRTGDLSGARRQLAEGLRVCREQCASDPAAPWFEVCLLNFIGVVSASRGDLNAAKALAREALELGRRHRVAVIALPLNLLGDYERAAGNWSKAEHYYDEALANFRATAGGLLLAGTLYNLAYVSRGRGDWRAAIKRISETLKLSLETGERWRAFPALSALAGIAMLAGSAEDGARALGAGQTHQPQPERVDAHAQERDRDELIGALGQEVFVRLYAEGQAMTAERAIGFAQGLIGRLLKQT